MQTTITSDVKQPTDYTIHRVHTDLTVGTFRQESVACEDLEDFLGGIARAFKLLAGYAVEEAFAPTSPVIMNLGVFSGTDVMTGLRIFFSAYSPLKVANTGRPLAMWSTASGKFGTKLLAAGVDEMILTDRYLPTRPSPAAPATALALPCACCLAACLCPAWPQVFVSQLDTLSICERHSLSNIRIGWHIFSPKCTGSYGLVNGHLVDEAGHRPDWAKVQIDLLSPVSLQQQMNSFG